MYWYINFKNEDWWKTEIMKIGKHIGKRAKINGNLGYFFETIDTGEHNLFVYDERLGHNAGSYFEKKISTNGKTNWDKDVGLFVYDREIGHNAVLYFHGNKHEWKDELKGRCLFAKSHDVILEKRIVL